MIFLAEKKESTIIRSQVDTIERFGSTAYRESADAIRKFGARVILAVASAVLIWLFGELVFLPISEDMTQIFLGYPVSQIISTIIVAALGLIILTVFIDIRKLTEGIGGVLAYQIGKTSKEHTIESVKNYKIAFNGVLYVVVISLTYLLFANYLGKIHPAIPAVLLILIVIWAVFALWRSSRAIASEVGRYTSKMADELEKINK